MSDELDTGNGYESRSSEGRPFTRKQLEDKASRLIGLSVPDVALRSCRPDFGKTLGMLANEGVVIYLYPGTPISPLEWTRCSVYDRAQHHAFSDSQGELAQYGCRVIGISTQSRAAAVHASLLYELRHELLSDERLRLGQAIDAPMFDAGRPNAAYYRAVLIVREGVIWHAYIPDTPERSAAQALAWLQAH